jgi:hypothetical protein
MALLRYRYIQSFGETVPNVNISNFWKIDINILRMMATLMIFNDVVELSDELNIQRIFMKSMKSACEIYGSMKRKSINDLFFICI